MVSLVSDIGRDSVEAEEVMKIEELNALHDKDED
jgi:hypothetical protein